MPTVAGIFLPLARLARERCRRMQSVLSVDRMSATERLDELAQILALGLARLVLKRAAKSSAEAGSAGDFPVDFTADQSVDRSVSSAAEPTT